MHDESAFDPTQHPTVQAIDAAISAFTQLRESGVKTVSIDPVVWAKFCSPVTAKKAQVPATKMASITSPNVASKMPTIPSPSEVQRTFAAKTTPPERQVTLSILDNEMIKCQLCPLAHTTRCSTIGSRVAPRVIVVNGAYMLGDRPEAVGSRLEGPAGEMLWKMLAAIQLTPQDTYITHAIRCPVQGRPPREAMLRCSEWLKREIRALAPQAIILLGPYAGSTLFPNASAAALSVGKWLLFEGIPCLTVHHPMRLQLLDEAIVRPMKMDNWTALKALRQRLK